MPSQISSKEVLTYLNYLGYNNVNAQQLKEFIQDLKKLIKYEERRKLKNNPEKNDDTSDCSPILTQSQKFKNDEKSQTELANHPEKSLPDIFTILHSHGTHSSKAKIVPRKESVISLQIKRNKCHHHCRSENKENVAYNCVENKSEHELAVTEEERQNDKDEGKQEDNKKPGKSKSKSSFIRPQIPVISKSDPVALYHYYKTGWDRYKIPGESHRSELRWAVREKMLNGPRPPRT